MIYIDDSIMQKSFPAAAGSEILKNFMAPFDATVITRINDKTERIKLGEFGLHAPAEIPGTPMLCNDIFGHVREMAVRQGLCYIRPAYGTVSRYGLIPAAASMDQIGIVCKDPHEGFSLLSEIAGYDENDGAMFQDKKYIYMTEKKDIKWGTPLDDYTGVLDQVMNILAYAEISNNISRYDGIKFGYRASGYKNLEELYTKTRTEGFGPEAKLAAIMGCMILSKENYDKYYNKAMRIRRLIKNQLKFDEYDVITLPVESPLAVLIGLPSLSFRHNGKTFQLMADVKKENVLLRAWEVMVS